MKALYLYLDLMGYALCGISHITRQEGQRAAQCDNNERWAKSNGKDAQNDGNRRPGVQNPKPYGDGSTHTSLCLQQPARGDWNVVRERNHQGRLEPALARARAGATSGLRGKLDHTETPMESWI